MNSLILWKKLKLTILLLMFAAFSIRVPVIFAGAGSESTDIVTSNSSSTSTNEENAYVHLWEVMDKYNKSFDVYTERDAGGNHYTPSGWMGDWEDITFDDDWTTNPKSGPNCTKISYSADFSADNHYTPSGWMGDWADIGFDDSWTTNAHSGANCTKIAYSAEGSQGEDWAGIYWQDPENNWGDKVGGFDLAGATKLTFWAKGENGGEKGEFKMGGINRFPYNDPDKPYQDSCDPLSTGIIALTDEWKQYAIDLATPSNLEVYTDKDAGGNNHYIPSGWYNGSNNMTLDDEWTDNPHSGSSCMKINWDGTPGNDGWKWNGIAWQQPEGNWVGDSGFGYDLTGATKLTFWARTDEPELEVKFLVGYWDDSSGEVLIDEDGWVRLSNVWTKYEIDLSDKDLSDIVCGYAFAFNDAHDPNPDGCTFYLDDITYDKEIEKDLSHIIGGFCWVTNAESNPNGCAFYLDDMRYEYGDKVFNVYTEPQQNWAGIYWQYPEENWGDKSGYDLTGATKLTFWAKGENGGEKGEFKIGGINRPPYNDPSKPYQDSCGPLTTGAITLANTWKQYTIDLNGEDLSCIIGGFCWVTNNAQNPNGCTIYLDDIRYDKERLDELRFLVSYETTSSPDDKYVKNTAFIYDNALAMLAFMARGNEGDWERAKTLGDSFVYCQNHDRYFPETDGRLRNAYQAGDLIDQETRKARLPGWWDDQEQKWCEDKYNVGTSTGNLAWVMIALLHYYEEKGITEYLETAKRMGDWIADPNKCYDTLGAGGYTGGYEGWEPNPTKFSWKSTEHNLDAYVAFTQLYQITGEEVWQERAEHAREFVEAMWDSSKGHFWTGTLNDGVTINKKVIPLDIQCWGLMVLDDVNKYGTAVNNWAQNNCSVNCDGFTGFDFDTDKDGVWFEGTAHMCLAYQLKGEIEKSGEYISELREAQGSAKNNNGKGIVAACHDGLTTGFDWLYYNRLHVGATAWFIFAERGLNPFWSTSIDTTPPSTPANLEATATSISEINLTWTASTDTGGSGLAGYKIERAKDVSGSPGTFTKIDTSSTNFCSDTGLSSNTKYWYRVRAYDGVGLNSDYSNIANATTYSLPPPGSTPGKVTGGGRINPKGNKCTFGFNAKYAERNQALTVELEYIDHGARMNMHSESLTGLAISDDRITAAIEGTCSVNHKSGYRFEVVVEDNGEPGKNDTYRIEITAPDASLFYTAKGVLSVGNIQIHK